MITADKILTMLTKLGADATLISYPSASFDPDTNRTIPGVATNTAVKAVPPYKNRETFGKDLITSGIGFTGISASEEVTPKVGMKITVHSRTWTITGVTPISSGDEIVYYQLEIEV